MHDFAAYLECANGPGQGVSGECDVFDFDEDGDVDFADLGVFLVAAGA